LVNANLTIDEHAFIVGVRFAPVVMKHEVAKLVRYGEPLAALAMCLVQQDVPLLAFDDEHA